jgi:hypothetical protein
MRRRSFLAATAIGVAAGLSGCLDGEIVMDVSETNTIPANRAWVQEIDEIDGSGGIAYTVRSEDDRFEVFYFRDSEGFQTYRQATLGGDEIPEDPPTGYDPLRAIAVENEERGAYEAEMPGDGGRHSLDFDGSHYFVVDNSNYGDIGVESKTADLPVVVSLEVVKDRF